MYLFTDCLQLLGELNPNLMCSTYRILWLQSELKSILWFDFFSVRLSQTDGAKGNPTKQVFYRIEKYIFKLIDMLCETIFHIWVILGEKFERRKK